MATKQDARNEATGCGLVLLALGLLILAAIIGGYNFGFLGVIGGMATVMAIIGLGILILAIADV